MQQLANLWTGFPCMQGNMIYTQVQFVIEKDWEKKSINGDGWINYNKLIQWNTMLQKKKKSKHVKTFYVLIWKILHEILRKKEQDIKSSIMCYFWVNTWGILVCIVLVQENSGRTHQKTNKNDYFRGDMNKEEG